MILRMIVFTCISYGIGLFLGASLLPFTLGCIVGLVFAIFKFKLMEKSLGKALKMDPEAAKKYAIAQYLLRYVLTAIILIIVVLNDQISLLGTVIGFLSMKAAAYMEINTSKTKKV